MKEVANYIKQVIIDKKNADTIKDSVRLFRQDYQNVQYCFDGKLGAYEYIKLR